MKIMIWIQKKASCGRAFNEDFFTFPVFLKNFFQFKSHCYFFTTKLSTFIFIFPLRFYQQHVVPSFCNLSSQTSICSSRNCSSCDVVVRLYSCDEMFCFVLQQKNNKHWNVTSFNGAFTKFYRFIEIFNNLLYGLGPSSISNS